MKENKVPEALKVLKEALSDDSYLVSWQANLAMCFKDKITHNPNKSLHDNCNDAAIEFINRLLNSNFKRVD